MHSINTPLANKSNSRQTARPTMQLLFQARKPKSVSSSKQRVANILVEEYKKPTPQQVVFPFFPTKNNNMTLEKMPVLHAGKETYVFQEGIQINSEPLPQPQPKPQQVVFPFFPTKNNNMTLEKMPVLHAGKETYVFQEGIQINSEPLPQPQPKPQQTWVPTWERDDKEKVIKNEKVHVELPEREIPVHDIVVNNTPKPIVPWKPTWER
jgi:hypothetical protein